MTYKLYSLIPSLIHLYVAIRKSYVRCFRQNMQPCKWRSYIHDLSNKLKDGGGVRSQAKAEHSNHTLYTEYSSCPNTFKVKECYG